MSNSTASYTYVTSTVLEASIDDTWPVVRDILQIAAIVVGSLAENVQWRGGASVDHVPASFTFDLAGGGPQLHQEVTGRSESEHWIEYTARNQVLSMIAYSAKISLQPITHPTGRTFATYARTFSLAPGSDPAVELPMLHQIMDNEMVALRDHFAPQA